MHRVLFAVPEGELFRLPATAATIGIVLLGLAVVGGGLYFFIREVARQKRADPEFDPASYLFGLVFVIAVGAAVLWGARNYLVAVERSGGDFVVSLQRFEIFTYGPVMAAGFLLAFALGYRIIRMRGEDLEFYMDLYIWVIISGLLGAKVLFSVIEFREWWPDFRQAPLATIGSLLNCRNGGLVWYGGVVLGTAVVLWYSRRRGLPMLQVTDTLAAPLALGLAIGRIGCLMGGCCFGGICNLPWAIKYPQECTVDGALTDIMPWDPRFSDLDFFKAHDCHFLIPLEKMALHSGITDPQLHILKVHPSPLYESLFCIALAAILYVVLSRKARMGVATALWFTLYPIARFLLEFLRGDAARKFLYQGDAFSISTSQALGLALLIGVAILWRHVLASPPRELVLAPKAPEAKESGGMEEFVAKAVAKETKSGESTHKKKTNK